VSDDVQLDDAPAELLVAARRVVPGWMRRVALAECARGGVDPSAIGPGLDRTIDAAATAALADLADLLATDVDEQRATPLSLLRSSTRPVEELLAAHGVSAPVTDAGPDRGAGSGLGPATWSDVDPSLHEPGLTWGAWKAMTVLGRRRDEGLR
jgi:hypothetical protein